MLQNERTKPAQPCPTDYSEALAVLGMRRERKIAHNTYLVKLGDGTVGVRLHNTYVVTFHAQGHTVLDSGGWGTVTTKERMNRYLPPGYRISAIKHVWHLYLKGEQVCEYDDGLIVRTAKVNA